MNKLFLLFTLIMAAFPALATEEATDPYIVDIYRSYCQACHSVASSGAPQAFERKTWNQLLDKGLDSVINNAVSGVGNMPPLGGCNECMIEDFADLIDYMQTGGSE